MSRETIVAGNWKLNKTVGETRQLIRELRNRLAGIDSAATVIVCPPTVALETAVDAARDTGIAVGAQNVYWETSGAFTGEVSPAMLEAVGVEYVLIGHSERRTIFGETDEDVNRKLHAVLRSDLTPVICLGESLGQREAGETEAVVRSQLGAGLEGVAPDHAGRLIIAYEPIWAIGTGKTATPEMVNDVHRLIRRTIADMFGGLAADGMSLLYGGSVKPENARSLMAEGDIDGVLVGGASLKNESFAEIVRAAP